MNGDSNKDIWDKLEAIHSDVQEMKVDMAETHATFKANVSNLNKAFDAHVVDDTGKFESIVKRVTDSEKGIANIDGKLIVYGAVIAVVIGIALRLTGI